MAPRLRASLLTPLIALALLLAACAGGSSPSSPPGSALATPFASAATSATAATFPLTLTDDAGREVTIPAEPQRIVSLAPSNTEIVCALQACERIVGVNNFRDGLPDDVLSSLADVPDVATFSGVDREQLVAQQPDLVLAAGNELTSSADISALADLGMPVLVLYPESLDEVYADIQLVGEAVGAREAGASLVARMRADVATIADRVAGLEAPRTFYEVGVYQGTIYTAGEDSFLASLIELAGGEPITGDPASTATQLEDLVAADPELILLGDAAYEPTITAESVAARPGWQGMTAVLLGRVVPMPEDLLITRPGPRIVDGLEILARAVHPEAFD